jgi:hypothetical protein
LGVRDTMEGKSLLYFIWVLCTKFWYRFTLTHAYPNGYSYSAYHSQLSYLWGEGNLNYFFLGLP